MASLQQSHRQIFLVTGANKGIGYEVVKKLCAKHPNDLILLGSRDQKRGEGALTKLGSPSNVKVLVLDITSKESIERAKEEIQKKYGGYLDVIINNAAVAGSELGLKSLKDTFNTNFYGVKQMNDTMSPLLRDNGRIVNVSSGAGALSMKHCSEDLKAKFLRPDLTEAELVQLFAPLFTAVEDGKDPQTVGFNPVKLPNFEHLNILYYSASKLGVNILTRLEARDWNKKYSAKNVIVSAVCPGFCATELNNNAEGGRSAELGADSILHAVYTQNLENGQFWRDGSLLPLESK
ncbi:unnamed protein product [Didymodactylos carnosus]|uniref:Uncharacterized protein n=1 Tax=Didymodactylos carnosus TaxID=1234261 RepID=A0A8S2FYN0_9BILA|nr:unnamed protein product [Didymodactylos carnosus]CAF4389216.1 unnamed protein product [Didymodactylos carnosus]